MKDDMPELDAKEMCNHVSRHRYRHELTRSPKDYWAVSFPASERM